MKFFNDKRTHSIHKGVVKPIKQEGPIWDYKVNGIPAPPGRRSIVFWRFDGVEDYMPGDSGGVFRLCEEYFKILRGLVAEWLGKRKELGIV
jgi:hypothetical protein